MTSKPALLSDTAQKVLAAAAARDDRLAVAPARLPRAACSAVARTLLRAGYLERAEAEPEALWYPEPGRATGLCLTEAGLRAIGLEPELDEPALVTPEEPPVVGQDAPNAAAVAESPPEPTPLLEAAQEASEAPVMEAGSGTVEDASSAPALPQAVGRSASSGLRRAAHDVVHAWDDKAGERAGLPDAVEHLRVLLARPTTTRARGCPELC